MSLIPEYYYSFRVNESHFQPHINPDSVFDFYVRRDCRYCVVRKRKCDIPAIGFVNDGAGFDHKAIWYRSVQNQFHIANLGKGDELPLDAISFHPWVRERPIPTTRLEPRFSRAFPSTVTLDETFKCLLDPSYHILQHICVDVFILWELSLRHNQIALLTIVFRRVSQWRNTAYQWTSVDGTTVGFPSGFDGQRTLSADSAHQLKRSQSR